MKVKKNTKKSIDNIKKPVSIAKIIWYQIFFGLFGVGYFMLGKKIRAIICIILLVLIGSIAIIMNPDTNLRNNIIMNFVYVPVALLTVVDVAMLAKKHNESLNITRD